MYAHLPLPLLLLPSCLVAFPSSPPPRKRKLSAREICLSLSLFPQDGGKRENESFGAPKNIGKINFPREKYKTCEKCDNKQSSSARPPNYDCHHRQRDIIWRFSPHRRAKKVLKPGCSGPRRVMGIASSSFPSKLIAN